MNEQFENIRLMPDINKYDHENIVFNYPGVKKIAAFLLISTLGVAGSTDIVNGKNLEYPKVDRQTVELVGYNLDHAATTVDIELNDKTAMLEIKIDKTSDEYLKRVAQECNLTLIDPDDYINILTEAKSYDEAVNCLNDYVANFGFQFKTIYKLDSTDKESGLYNRAILDPKYINEYVILDRFKQTATILMQSLGYTPVEFIRASKLKEVRFLKGFGENSAPVRGYSAYSTAPAAMAMEDNNLVDFAISSFSPYDGPEIFFHEIGHLIDGQEMGNIQQNDPQYTSLNPKSFKYFDEKSYQENKNAVVDEYASLNAVEDKGMIYQNFIFGPRLAYSDDPIIREKTRLLVARLERNIPNISDYYAALCSVSVTDINK